MDQEFIQLIEQLQKKAQKNMPALKVLVGTILEKKVTDKIEIEHTLDTLLDYTMLGLGKEEFERLNDYYGSVNKDHANFYWRHYRDMLGSD
ncbi:MAG TPA: hypothetical protein VJB13_04555 [Candidatus Nanoarchaeia archaeon]|nr:hypothetical protein [Candidatus Nanoarchaeia archaeon]